MSDDTTPGDDGPWDGKMQVTFVERTDPALFALLAPLAPRARSRALQELASEALMERRALELIAKRRTKRGKPGKPAERAAPEAAPREVVRGTAYVPAPVLAPAPVAPARPESPRNQEVQLHRNPGYSENRLGNDNSVKRAQSPQPVVSNNNSDVARETKELGNLFTEDSSVKRNDESSAVTDKPGNKAGLLSQFPDSLL